MVKFGGESKMDSKDRAKRFIATVSDECFASGLDVKKGFEIVLFGLKSGNDIDKECGVELAKLLYSLGIMKKAN